MKGTPILLVTVALLALTACASPTSVNPTQLSSSDQVETVVAATMQALPTNTPAAIRPESPAEMLPHTLYYLSNDGIYRRENGTLLTQVYRMERDGKTITRLTDEPNGVDGYDVSIIDGTVAFIADNQLALINADGSNRRVLVDGGSEKLEYNPYFYKDPVSEPVFSPDGQTIAYAHQNKSVVLYDVASGISNVIIKNDKIHVGNWPVRYSPDGTKLLIALGQWENPPKYTVYDIETGVLTQSSEEQRFFCCSALVWSLDGSSFYGIVRAIQNAYQVGAIQRVDAATGTVTILFPFIAGNPVSEIMNSPSSPYFAPDGWLYYFFGSYRLDSGYYEPPVIQLIRSAPDGITNRIVLRDENFVLMNEALWAPDASFVIVSMTPSRDWNQNQGSGVLELYYTDAQKSVVLLASFGYQMKWGP